MSVTQSMSGFFPLRKAILLAIAACLLVHCILFSGYVLANLGEIAFVVSVLSDTLIVFCLLYRTPLFLRLTGRWARASRVVCLILIAHCFAIGVPMAVAILWFIACAVLGFSPRDV